MELLTNPNPQEMVHDTTISTTSFIEANTEKVSLDHLQNDCIIPVFSKDNETTISHYQFINETYNTVNKLFPEQLIKEPSIRVSHVVKGRTPSAIGKPAKELTEDEKTIYYERCAFIIEIPTIQQEVNGNMLSLFIGGVRAYNQENLYSKKSAEKFKVFIGFKNLVCTNLCISTDGFSNQIRVTSITQLEQQIAELIENYDSKEHIKAMHNLARLFLTERQFAHFIGKLRMYYHLEASKQKKLLPISFNDSQINNVVKDYYNCPHFRSQENGTISLWSLYNLFTEANKSSYIDSNFERNVNAYALIQEVGKSIENGSPNWLLP